MPMRLSTSMLSTIALSWFLFSSPVAHATPKPPPRPNVNLEVLRIAPAQSPSFDPESSDYLGNMIILGQLVTTLVAEKHGNSGESEPYLAKRWDASPDGLTWSFDLHDGVLCEDGTEIDAPGLIRSLHRIFRQNVKNGKLPVFDGLAGWDTFVATGKDFPGLRAPSRHVLQMKFLQRPSGLLQYLGMPVYGYWCDGGFQGDKWKDKHAITSSGPYRVSAVRDDGYVELTRRDDFKLLPDGAAQKITFQVGPDAASQLGATSTSDIVMFRSWAGQPYDESKFIRMNGTPTMMNFITLASTKDHFFADAGARRIFAARFRAAQDEGRFHSGSPVAVVSRDFYPSAPGVREMDAEKSYAAKPLATRPAKPLRLHIRPNVLGPDLDYIKGLVASVLGDLGVAYELTDSKFLSDRSMTSEDFDIRIGGVDAGSGFENWLTKMMFCSSLGVRLPDPSGRICALTQGVEDGSVALSHDEYAQRFNAILADDAAMLPVSRYGITWFFARNLDLSKVTPALVVPRFEWMRKTAP